MHIRMVQERTGGRWDGRPWPPVGGTIDVIDEEGAAICAAGWAVPVVTEKRKTETPEDTLKVSEETREAPPEPVAPSRPAAASASSPPAVNDPKSAWVAHAVSRGAQAAYAETLTKQQLIERYGT